MVNIVPSRKRPQESGLATHRDNPFMELRRRMDDLFENFLGRWGALREPSLEELRVWDFDVSEKEDEVAVRAELPGFEADEINVQAANNLLIVKAEKRETAEGRETFKAYQRTVSLPSGADESHIDASYHNGVLEIHIPRREEAKAKRIPVRCEPGPQQPAVEGRQAGRGREARSSALPTAEASESGSKAELQNEN